MRSRPSVGTSRGRTRPHTSSERSRSCGRRRRATVRPPPDHMASSTTFSRSTADVECGNRKSRPLTPRSRLAGALTAGEYFNRDTPAERSIRDLTDRLVHRADWLWSIDGGSTVSHGWRPESGFLRSRWQGYSEALILYVLGLGSPTRPLPAESFRAWTTSYRWRALYGHELLYAGPLFIHQLSHCWIDFRGIRDAYMRDRGIDYFENSRRATYVQRAYATRNPKKWTGYSATNWGITASDGPGPASRAFHGSRRRFYGYHARGVPFGPDDGTLSPCAVVASLPFAPEIVLPCIAFDRRIVSRSEAWIRVHRQHQPFLSAAEWKRIERSDPLEVSSLVIARPLRDQSGPSRVDDRELPLRSRLASHEPGPLHRHRSRSRRVRGRWLG